MKNPEKYERRNQVRQTKLSKALKKNKALIKKSLEELGAGRSVVIDREGELIRGGAKCGLTTNGWQTAANTEQLSWVRLSVYGVNCKREIENVLATNAAKHNAALFYKGIEDLRKYTFLLDKFDEVTVKTLNDSTPLTDNEVREIVALGFRCKQNPTSNDFKECKFGKPCYDPEGKEHKCCLCKADGGFFGVDKCIVPCVMYQSNKRGEMVWNKYGFAV